MLKNKKAQIMNNGNPIWNIYVFIVVALLVVLLFAGWIYITGLLNTVFTDIGLQNEARAGQPMYTNMTLAAQQTFGQMNTGIQALRMVALVYILAMVAVILISNALVKTHPIWFFPYVLMTGLAVIFAVPISNSYINILDSGVFGGELTNSGWTAVHYILLNLPVFVMFLGLIGGIFLLINLIRADSNPNLEQ